MKYVMLKRRISKGASQLVPILFPDNLTHKTVAEAVRRMPELREATIHSAGFAGVDVVCHGASETLNIRAHKDDDGVINSMDYLHGITDNDE